MDRGSSTVTRRRLQLPTRRRRRGGEGAPRLARLRPRSGTSHPGRWAGKLQSSVAAQLRTAESRSAPSLASASTSATSCAAPCAAEVRRRFGGRLGCPAAAASDPASAAASGSGSGSTSIASEPSAASAAAAARAGPPAPAASASPTARARPPAASAAALALMAGEPLQRLEQLLLLLLREGRRGEDEGRVGRGERRGRGRGRRDLAPLPPSEGRTEAPVGTPQFPPPFGGPDRGVEGPALSLS